MPVVAEHHVLVRVCVFFILGQGEHVVLGEHAHSVRRVAVKIIAGQYHVDIRFADDFHSDREINHVSAIIYDRIRAERFHTYHIVEESVNAVAKPELGFPHNEYAVAFCDKIISTVSEVFGHRQPCLPKQGFVADYYTFIIFIPDFRGGSLIKSYSASGKKWLLSIEVSSSLPLTTE